jgi:flagellar biosynthesis protein FliQ
LIPAITPLVEQITTVVVHVSEWIEKNPKLVEIIGEIGVVLAVGGPVLVGIGMLIKAIQAIGSIGAVTTPIGALAVAIGAIIVIWKNWDEIVEYVEGFVSKIKDFFSDLMDFVQGIVQKIEDFITGLIDKIKTAITDLKDMLKISSGDTAVSSGGMGAGGVRKLIEQHETGIDYVPQTGLALIHEGEAVLNKMDAESYRKGNMGMSYNPSISITVQGDGDESKIRRAVEQALNESARQFRRTGYELIPGMG